MYRLGVFYTSERICFRFFFKYLTFKHHERSAHLTFPSRGGQYTHISYYLAHITIDKCFCVEKSGHIHKNKALWRRLRAKTRELLSIVLCDVSQINKWHGRFCPPSTWTFEMFCPLRWIFGSWTPQWNPKLKQNLLFWFNNHLARNKLSEKDTNIWIFKVCSFRHCFTFWDMFSFQNHQIH